MNVAFSLSEYSSNLKLIVENGSKSRTVLPPDFSRIWLIFNFEKSFCVEEWDLGGILKSSFIVKRVNIRKLH